jgi:outer membrane protein
MMTKRFLIVVSVGYMCFAACAGAQTVAPSLTLAEAEALALKSHPQILASEAGYLRADQITVEARAAYYPSFNGEITGAQANQDARLGAGVLNDPRLFNHFGSGIALSQLITDSGRTPNLVANSKLSAQASREDSRATRYNVIIGVDRAYYEVLLSQQLVRVAEQTVKTRQTLVDQISELTKNKLKSEVDLSFVEVNLSEAQLMLLRAKDQLTAAYASFGQALGSQQATQYQLAEPTQQPDPPSSDPEPSIQQALQNRPELASLNFQTQADQKFVYAERDLKRPTVSLVAAGGVLPFIEPGNANPNIPAEYESAGVNVQIPIFNGHLFSARRRAAEYQLQATQQRARDLQDRIASDVRTAWAQATTSFQAIATSERLLKQANMALDLAQGRYDLGLSSIVELTQAQLGQTQAQVENVDAKYQYQEAYAVLQYTLGLRH